MASELIVQTIKGPTSGANANKIIVASGNTLMPSVGQVLKTEIAYHASTSGQNVTTSTNYVGSGLYIDYTPVASNSLIIIQAVFNSKNDNGSTADGAVFQIQRHGVGKLGTGQNSDTFHYDSQYGGSNSHLPGVVLVSEIAGSTASRRYELYMRSFNTGGSGINFDWGTNVIKVTEIAQ